ncbi:Formate/nitrite transporter-domain-containing protein [Xylogone sp. PMI_703]|nr:Formate/nitrite transporter-domain-containing protein [Xylogone sp. PMI_703]
MDAFTPAQTTELISRIGAKKCKARLDKMFVNSFMGGMMISVGGALALSTNTAPWFQTNAPGLIRTIGAFVFPVGLIMTVLTGADLFTSYCMYSVVAVLHRRATIFDLAKTWFISFFANLAGALFFMALLSGYPGTFETGAYKEEAISFAKAKAVTPEWHQIFLKGIVCNWLVCLAVFLAVSSRDNVSKMLGVWFPVMCFVGLGTDHVIANMYFIPLAIFLGAPEPLTVKYYIWKSMIPSGLGNIVGGGLFTGVLYWYLFLHNEEVPIHFDSLPIEATEFGAAPGVGDITSGNGTGYNVTEGKAVHRHVLPDSGNMARSGIAKDYHVAHFKKDNSASDSSV